MFEVKFTHVLVRNGRVARRCFSEKHARAERIADSDIVLPLEVVPLAEGQIAEPGEGDYEILADKVICTPRAKAAFPIP